MALTPWDVWLEWKGALVGMGGHLSAQVNEKPDKSVTLRDVHASIIRPDLYGDITIRELTLVPAGDGSVVAMLPAVPIKIELSPRLARLDMTLTFQGGQVRIAGTGNARRYILGLDAVDVAWTGWQGSSDAQRSGAIHGQDLVLDATGTAGTMAEHGYHFSANTVTYDISAKTSKLAEATQDVGRYQGLTSQGRIAGPSGYAGLLNILVTPADRIRALRRMLEAGLTARFSMTAGASESHMAQTRKGKTVLSWSDVQAGSLTVSLDRAGVVFDATEAAGSLGHSDAFMDLQLAFDAAEFGVTWPLLGEAFEPLRLKLRLSDLTMPPAWWASHDPKMRFVHDPMQVDLLASAMVRTDSLGQILSAVQHQPGPEPAFQSMTLERLALSGLGATLQASGAFTVDNAGRRPIPAGKAEARLTGIYGLLDGLQAQGILSADQNMGARFVLLRFFRPSDDLANGLAAQVEARPDGSLWVNGARFR